MADRPSLPIMVAFLVLISGCASARPSGSPTASPGWSAVGVPASRLRSPSVAIVMAGPSAIATSPARRPSTRLGKPRPVSASAPGAAAFPVPQSVDGQSIDAVAVAGARALASADTAVDNLPQHTAVRAARAGWLTARYANAQLHASAASASGAQWDRWTRHRAYVVVTAKLNGDDHPPDAATSAVRTVLLTEQAIGRDGWHDITRTRVVAVVLKKVNGTWRIDNDQPT